MNLSFLFVAAIYFAAVALWRYLRNDELPWRMAIFFYLVVLLFLFKPLTQDFVHVPADHLATLHPWRGAQNDHTVANMEINDIILQMVPWSQQVRESWLSGRAPLWNDHAGGGYPLLANGQSAALSPVRLVTLPLSLGESFTAEAALKILAALTATFLFLRRRYSLAASTIGAISFGFSTILMVWLHFPHASVISLLPATFLGMELLFERLTYRRFVFLSLIFAAVFLGGHPESTAHIGFACALFLIYLISTAGSDRWRKAGVVCLTGVTAVLIAAPFLLTFFEALPRSQRYEWLEHSKPHPYTPNLPAFVLLFQPRFFGLIRDWTNVGPGFAEMVCGSAGILGLVGWIMATIATIRRRPAPRFFVYAIPIIAGVALAWPPILQAFEQLPLFSLAANARMRLVLCFFFALFAAYTVDHARRERATLFIAVGATAALLLFTWLRYLPTAAAREQALLTSIPALITLGLVLALAWGARLRALRLPLLAAVTLELWTFGYRWNPVVPAEEMYPRTPLINRLLASQAEDVKSGAPHRVVGLRSALFPNGAAMYGLDDVRSHDPMSFGRVLGLLRAFTGYSSDEYFGMLEKPQSRLLDFLSVKYIVTTPVEEIDDPRLTAIYSGRDGRIYQNRTVLPRFFAARHIVNEFDDVKRVERILAHQDWRDVIVKRLPSHLGSETIQRLVRSADHAQVRSQQLRADRFVVDVKARDWTLIASSQPDWPGWKAFSNGKRLKLITINETFFGFIVPAGRSRIEVVYMPMSWRVGATISITTLAALLLVGLALRRPRSGGLRPPPMR